MIRGLRSSITSKLLPYVCWEEQRQMFKTIVTTSGMLAGVVCGSVFMCAIECAQGTEMCDVWFLTALMSIIALSAAVIWMMVKSK